eukprot:m.489581 g.489581  ORF g.489581 m.489581 type:complete len:188 (+) comp26901_c0_seq1:134-697(+)
MVVLRAKCIIAGEPGVGKSALSQVFHSDGVHFPKAYTMTTGIDYIVKTVNIPDSSDIVELHLLDSAGDAVFADRLTQQWDSASLFVVVYDVTKPPTLDACASWIERCQNGKTPAAKGVLVANKVDLESRRVVSRDDGQHVAKSQGLPYFEASAKENQDVDVPFLYLASQVHKSYQDSLVAFEAAVAQ